MAIENHLFILVSIITGLGMAEIFAGWGNMIRKDSKPYWPQLGWTLLAFLTMVQLWWANRSNLEQISQSLLHFLIFLVSPSIIYVIIILILPDFGDGGLPVKDHFHLKKKYVYGLSASVPVVNIFEEYWFHTQAMGWRNLLRLIAVPLLVLGCFIKGEWYHKGLILLLTVLLVIFMAFNN